MPAALASDLPADIRRARVLTGLLPAVVEGDGATATSDLRQRMADLHVPGVALAAVVGGRIDWVAGFGHTGGPSTAQVTADTLFQAGSVSKPVAAMTAVALADQGHVDLDVPIAELLAPGRLRHTPYAASRTVTLRSLLRHTAGATVHGFAGYPAGAPVPTVAQVLTGEPPATSEPVTLTVPPGDGFRYSGGGYTIVQQALTDTLGLDFAELAQATVLEVLGMSASTFTQPLPTQGLPGTAWPHDAAGAAVVGGPRTYPELAAAGLWTSARELAAVVVELTEAWHGGGRVLSETSVRTMLTPGAGSWGLGFQVGGQAAQPYAYHDGANAGYKATLAAYPSRGEGVVVLTNGDQGYQLGQEVLRAVATVHDWPDFRPVRRDRVALTPSELPSYVGSYRIPDLGTFDVRLHDGQLWLEIRAGQVLRMIPSGAGSFFVTEQDLVVTFAAAAAGDRSERGTLAAADQVFTFTRAED